MERQRSCRPGVHRLPGLQQTGGSQEMDALCAQSKKEAEF